MNNLILIKPSDEYIEEIRAYRQEFFDEGGHFHGDSGLRKFDDISAWIENCRLMEHKETVPNPLWVEAEQFMLVNNDRILGMINFRHYLNDYLAEYGGHIGYGVRPSERRKGYAKAMLTLCLEKCRERGLHRVLITCDRENEASRRTILACGGVFDRTATENEEILERYWFALAPAFPATLAEKLSGFTLTKNTIGCSASGVYHCQSETDSLYLKIQKLNAGVIKELEIISWLDGKLPVPKIKYFYEDNGYSYLLMTAVDGYMSCECPGDELLKPFENTVKLLAEGLLMLQNVDITDCPFENSLSIKLKDALYNIEHGLVNLDDFEEDNDFDTPMDLYHWLTENKPPEELFFTHGDYCLPNIFIDGNSITGFIDLGNAGIADKWQDIALCVRSIGYNLRNCEEKDRYVRMLFDYLNIEPDWKKIKYYILLDELF